METCTRCKISDGGFSYRFKLTFGKKFLNLFIVEVVFLFSGFLFFREKKNFFSML